MNATAGHCSFGIWNSGFLSDLAQSLIKVPSLRYLPIIEFVTIVYLASLLKQSN